ncbi:MAG: metalloregulator ArsR/SmtB family transcription factor [Candidatus Aenigmatarchaeota archaeon]
MSSKLLKALSDPTRLKIVEILEKGEICACKFAPLTKKAQPTVSQHLKILENAGIIKSRKEGKNVMYSVADKRIFDLIKAAREIGDR